MAGLEVEIVVGTYDHMIRGLSYDLLNENEVLKSKYHEKGHMGLVSSLASSGGVLASGSADETIKLYNIRNHTEIGTLMQHEGTITCLQFYDDKLISTGEDGLICMWDCHNWECQHYLTGHRGAVLCIAVHPSGKIALSVGKDKSVRTWDLVNGRQAFVKRFSEVPDFVVWSIIGDQYMISFNNFMMIYDVQTGGNLQKINIGKHINSVVFLQDSLIAIGCELPDILIYSTTNGKCQTRLTGHTNRVKSLQFLSGANLLFSASSNGSVRIWKVDIDNLSLSVCITEAAVSSRITCMTVIYPEGLSTNELVKATRLTKNHKTVNTEEDLSEGIKGHEELSTLNKATFRILQRSGMMKQEMKSIKHKKRKHMIPSKQTEYVIIEDENPLSNDRDEDDRPSKRTKKSNYNSLKNISDSKQKDSRLLKRKRVKGEDIRTKTSLQSVPVKSTKSTLRTSSVTSRKKKLLKMKRKVKNSL